MTSPSPAPAGRPTDETEEAMVAAIREGFRSFGHPIKEEWPYEGATEMVMVDGCASPETCEMCAAEAALSVLAADLQAAEQRAEEAGRWPIETLDESALRTIRAQAARVTALEAALSEALGIAQAAIHNYTAYSAFTRIEAVLAGSASPGGAETLAHGRHCSCTACANEDWTRTDLAPCGTHGPDCPNVYAPAAAVVSAEPTEEQG